MHWTVPGEEFTWTPEDTQTQLDKLVGVKNKRQRLAAQGAVLVFMGIVVLYAWWMNRVEARQAAAERKDG